MPMLPLSVPSPRHTRISRQSLDVTGSSRTNCGLRLAEPPCAHVGAGTDDGDAPADGDDVGVGDGVGVRVGVGVGVGDGDGVGVGVGVRVGVGVGVGDGDGVGVRVGDGVGDGLTQFVASMVESSPMLPSSPEPMFTNTEMHGSAGSKLPDVAVAGTPLGIVRPRPVCVCTWLKPAMLKMKCLNVELGPPPRIVIATPALLMSTPRPVLRAGVAPWRVTRAFAMVSVTDAVTPAMAWKPGKKPLVTSALIVPPEVGLLVKPPALLLKPKSNTTTTNSVPSRSARSAPPNVMGPLLPGSPSQSTSPVMQPPVFKPASEAESATVLQL
jgi:hypothetical protein